MKRLALTTSALLLLTGCNDFTRPEPRYPNRDAAMDACIDYLGPAVERELAKEPPLTWQEKKALWQREETLPAEQKTDTYAAESKFKNTDGKYQVLDIYCTPKVRSKLFGLYTWMEGVPMVNWLEIPTDDCEFNCTHEFKSEQFYDWDSYLEDDDAELPFFTWPRAKR